VALIIGDADWLVNQINENPIKLAVASGGKGAQGEARGARALDATINFI